VIVAGFHSRDDDWILPHKLRVLSAVADKIIVLLDRSPQSEAICRRFPKVECHHWQSTRDVPELASGHRACEEGAMRQWVWDRCAAFHPKFVILGDSDEVPTPDIRRWFASGPDDAVDCWYMDWVNLIGSAGKAIGGDGPWSYQNPTANKKGAIVRYRRGREYRYRTDSIVHTRLEPSPVREAATVYDDRHRISPVRLVHYKWANWQAWKQSPTASLPQWNPWPPADAEIVDVPRSWLWRWDADELIESLPEPIAVVGNGPMTGHGAEIDGHATVIRFNNWKTDGFAEHVGSKTTVWCCNCWDDVAMRPWTGDMLTVTTDTEQYDRNSRWLGAYPHMHVPSWSWTDAVRRIKPNNPSTGLVLLHRLVMAGKRVDAYGFTGLSGGHYWDPEHVHTHSGSSAALATLAGMGIRFS
jgi:hypothetical protein